MFSKISPAKLRAGSNQARVARLLQRINYEKGHPARKNVRLHPAMSGHLTHRSSKEVNPDHGHPQRLARTESRKGSLRDLLRSDELLLVGRHRCPPMLLLRLMINA